MARAKIVLIGAGSRSFGPGTVRDVLLSQPLKEAGVDLVLMDTVEKHVRETEGYAKSVNDRLKANANISSTTDLGKALDGANAVVSAIEVNRYLYWSQDFHIPRKYGFRQIYGENGGPGGIFHALRNMGPTVHIAKEMEKRSDKKAVLYNYTNPEPKLCEAVVRLTKTPVVGLCHGVFMGLHQISRILGKPMDEIEFQASGMNHFTWFQVLKDKKTGKDLYPDLKKADREGDWLAEWHELVLSRILLRRFGLWPSPGANHIGEYLHWADEFHAAHAQYFYDPADGHPWTGGVPQPEFIYSLQYTSTDRGWKKAKNDEEIRKNEESKAQEQRKAIEDKPLKPSAELAVPIMESLLCGVKHDLAAINIRNNGAIPNLPDDMVVEVPATSDGSGWKAVNVPPLPEPVAATIRLYGSIHKLLVEAYAGESKEKLLQAVLLEPTVHSYRSAVQMVDEMIGLQKELLPALK